MTIADIASAHTGAADICFLVAVVLGVLAALGGHAKSPAATTLGTWVAPLASAALAALALGFLLL